MRTQKTPKNFLSLLATALVVFAGACSSDSPTEPSRPPATPPGGGGGATAFSVTVTADPGTLPAGEDDPVVITVRAVRTDNGQPAPDGTLAVVSSLVGAFGQPGGPQSVTIELVNGVGQIVYFPPVAEEATVVVRATVAGSAGQTTIRIEGTATFFVSHVAPASGSPQGGDSVAIHGSGFDGPVRVLFGGTNATVQSVTPNRIVVRTPPSSAGLSETNTVSVSVTINVNEADQATDTVIGAFTYVPGGGDVRQPAIFSITPTTGPNEGGTPISIIGEGFQAPVQVEFGNGNVFLEAQVVSVQPGRIEVISPAATGFGAELRDETVTIRLTNLSSGLTAVRTDAFRYGVRMQATGLSPDVVDAQNPALVTIFGTGFESPLQVLVNGLQQQVVSVTGTQIVFRPSAIAVTGCGDVTLTGTVTVRPLSGGPDSGGLSLGFRSNIPQPLITSISPNSGPAGGGTTVNINGSGFDAPVRVLFGPNQATLQNTTPTQVRVTSPAFTGTFPTEACTAAGDVPGTRQTPASVPVTVTNLDSGCADTVAGGFVYQPSSTCVPNEAPPGNDDDEEEEG